MKQKIGIRKANEIAKRYISSLITMYDGFYSELLSYEENQLVRKETLKIALKLYDGDCIPTTNEVVKSVVCSADINTEIKLK